MASSLMAGGSASYSGEHVGLRSLSGQQQVEQAARLAELAAPRKRTSAAEREAIEIKRLTSREQRLQEAREAAARERQSRELQAQLQRRANVASLYTTSSPRSAILQRKAGSGAASSTAPFRATSSAASCIAGSSLTALSHADATPSSTVGGARSTEQAGNSTPEAATNRAAFPVDAAQTLSVTHGATARAFRADRRAGSGSAEVPVGGACVTGGAGVASTTGGTTASVCGDGAVQSSRGAANVEVARGPARQAPGDRSDGVAYSSRGGVGTETSCSHAVRAPGGGSGVALSSRQVAKHEAPSGPALVAKHEALSCPASRSHGSFSDRDVYSSRGGAKHSRGCNGGVAHSSRAGAKHEAVSSPVSVAQSGGMDGVVHSSRGSARTQVANTPATRASGDSNDGGFHSGRNGSTAGINGTSTGAVGNKLLRASGGCSDAVADTGACGLDAESVRSPALQAFSSIRLELAEHETKLPVQLSRRAPPGVPATSAARQSPASRKQPATSTVGASSPANRTGDNFSSPFCLPSAPSPSGGARPESCSSPATSPPADATKPWAPSAATTSGVAASAAAARGDHGTASLGQLALRRRERFTREQPSQGPQTRQPASSSASNSELYRALARRKAAVDGDAAEDLRSTAAASTTAQPQPAAEVSAPSQARTTPGSVGTPEPAASETTLLRVPLRTMASAMENEERVFSERRERYRMLMAEIECLRVERAASRQTVNELSAQLRCCEYERECLVARLAREDKENARARARQEEADQKVRNLEMTAQALRDQVARQQKQIASMEAALQSQTGQAQPGRPGYTQQHATAAAGSSCNSSASSKASKVPPIPLGIDSMSTRQALSAATTGSPAWARKLPSAGSSGCSTVDERFERGAQRLAVSRTGLLGQATDSEDSSTGSDSPAATGKVGADADDSDVESLGMRYEVSSARHKRDLDLFQQQRNRTGPRGDWPNASGVNCI